jgi:hypothetical protein
VAVGFACVADVKLFGLGCWPETAWSLPHSCRDVDNYLFNTERAMSKLLYFYSTNILNKKCYKLYFIRILILLD